MTENEFSLKELYDVSLKTTSSMEINGELYVEGEILTVFDKIQISVLNQVTRRITAHGGFQDRPIVFWDTPREVDIAFNQGIFSNFQLGLLGNSRLLEKKENTPIEFTQRERIETNEEGKVTLKYTPKSLYIYDSDTYAEITDFRIEGKTLEIGQKYHTIVVDYTFDYYGSGEVLRIGHNMINDYLRLEGRTRVKDDITGKTRTGIFIIPRLRLMSDISMRLGRNADPVIANFTACGFPIGPRYNEHVMELYTLDEDIDSDM